MKEIAISTRTFNDATALIFDKHNNPGINLTSIKDVLILCKYNDIDPKKVQHLIIPHNSIRDISNITLFENLKELNLTGNHIINIDHETIAFFHGRIMSYSSQEAISFHSSAGRASFILFLSENHLTRQTIDHILKISESDEPYPKKYLAISSSLQKLELDIKKTKKKILSSISETLGAIRKYGNLGDAIKNKLQDHVNQGFEGYHEMTRRGIYFMTDLKPSNYHTKYSSQNYYFLPSIPPGTNLNNFSIDKEKLIERRLYLKQSTLPTLKNILEYLEEKNNISLEFVRSFKIQALDKSNYHAWIFGCIASSIGWIILFGSSSGVFYSSFLYLLTVIPIYNRARYLQVKGYYNNTGSEIPDALFILCLILAFLIDFRILVVLLPIAIERNGIIDNKPKPVRALERSISALLIPLLIILGLYLITSITGFELIKYCPFNLTDLI